MDRLIKPALGGFPVAWMSPTFPMMTEIWRELRNTLAPVTSRVSAQEHRIELITGGIIDLWSLDSFDSIRGRKYKRVVLDEAAMVKNLQEAWNAAIRPTLTDYQGDGWFLSTPKGRGFFWEAYTYGEDPHNTEWACFQMPTLANPFILPQEIEAMRLSLPERLFQQEIEARFLDNSGGVFLGVRAAIDAGRDQNEPPRGQGYHIGVDLARVEDFTVIDVVDAQGRQVYHERFNQISWERQTETIKRVAVDYPGKVFLDSTGVGDPIFERLRKDGVNIHPYHFSNQSKEALIDNLAMKIEQGSARLMDLPVQTNELLAFQYELTPSRNVRMAAPVGMHDDAVIALALAYWGLANERELQVWSF